MSDETTYRPVEVDGVEVGPALSDRERRYVNYWLKRGGREVLRETDSLEGFSKIHWDGRDEYIIGRNKPVGMTLSGRKADTVLDWLGSITMTEIENAL